LYHHLLVCAESSAEILLQSCQDVSLRHHHRSHLHLCHRPVFVLAQGKFNLHRPPESSTCPFCLSYFFSSYSFLESHLHPGSFRIISDHSSCWPYSSCAFDCRSLGRTHPQKGPSSLSVGFFPQGTRGSLNCGQPRHSNCLDSHGQAPGGTGSFCPRTSSSSSCQVDQC